MSGNWDLPQGRMNCPDDAEKSSRILALAQVILKAGNALEASDWLQCQKLCGEAARMSRVLVLMTEKENP